MKKDKYNAEKKTTSSSPLNGSIRGPQYLNTKEEEKTWIPD